MFLVPYSVIELCDHVNVYIQYPAVLLNILVISISLRKVKPSLPRTYCLNISIVSLISALYTICRDLTRSTVFKEYSDSFNVVYVLTVSILNIMLLQSALNLYLFQATLTILLAYIGLCKPILYKRLSTTKAFFQLFIATHVVSWLLAAGETLEYFSMQPLFKNYNRTVLLVHTWTRLGIQISLFAFMACLYIRTLVKLAIYAYGHIAQTSSQQTRWLILRSVIIYCTPPNLFLVVGIAGSYCSAEQILMPTELQEVTTCTPIKYLTEQLIMLRLFVTSLSALFAFSDYRKALLSMVVGIVRRKSAVGLQSVSAHSNRVETERRAWRSPTSLCPGG
ncbi:hypothetical protein QR680_006149 [Steinernema hermaphroditum]|uniref:Uncharacterized protein n=1 Tax=Steinernema hermaphroditum TaxID=289476 RepID=A0AA39LWX2_9BILA|nr:hypothetical protein QR680_006149 [Steinernema hermaphroditum]